MRSLSDTLERLARMRSVNTAVPTFSILKKLDRFGSNPGALTAWHHVPKQLPPAPALVVVLHGCTQTAAGYDIGSGWSALAEDYGFVVLFPEQTRQNNANLCFNWFNAADTRRGHGEVMSIRQMVATMVAEHNIDERRIYMTGLSAGGAMANAVLACYPEVFAGGAIIAGLPYAFVPYARPGLPLTQAIMRRIDADTRILVLGNHGLTVAGETVADAEALLGEVRRRLTLTARAVVAPDIGSLERLAVGSAYRPPSDPAAHGVATDPVSCRHAGGGSLYPDHVIFLGEGSVIAQPGESGLDVERRFGATGLPLPPTILFPGKGVLVSTAISEGALAMAGCLSHVTSRLPETARLRYFSDLENAELLGWDAEKYRQALNASLDGGRR